MTTILAISPHLDDAIFSAGGLLRRCAMRGYRVMVATVFTGNVVKPEGFALACQLDKGLGPEVDYMALRRAEDRNACDVLGIKARHLALLEAPHRGYADAAALFGRLREDDDAVLAVRAQLEALLAKIEPQWVLGPQGIGGHVDHLVVRRAIEAIRPPRVLWWTDWPYALRHQPPAERLRSVWLPLGLTAQQAKIRACSAYGSQLSFQFGGADKLREQVLQQRGERFSISVAQSGHDRVADSSSGACRA